MRIALISDIHGNLPALNAVLSEIESLKVDQIACLGDICDLGPEPSKTLQRIRDLECIVIQGNHDPFDEEGPSPIQAISTWCAEQLNQEERAYLKALALSHEFHLPQGRKLLAVHGSPRGFTDGMVAAQSTDEVRTLLTGVSADVIAGGHTHVQLLRRVDHQLIVNVGSVGCPFAEVFSGAPPTILPWAEYAVITGTEEGISVDLRRVHFDTQKLVDAIMHSSMPHAGEWASQWQQERKCSSQNRFTNVVGCDPARLNQ